VPGPDWSALRRAIAGDVVTPDAPDYDDARRPAIANFEAVRPAAVVRCAAPADVAQALAFAASEGLATAARSGGHCFAGRSSTTGVVIDVAPLRSIAAGDVVTVGAGARLGEIYDALAVRSRTLAAGCGPTVGIAGLTLGGGFGILGRAHGLTSDQLLAAQVVLADGRVIECDEEREPDLFWALRGAGGCRFGILTTLVFRTVPAPEATSFHLTWPHSDAAALVAAWQAWSPDTPDELAASLLVTAGGAAAEPPLVSLFGAMAAGETDTAQQLETLVARAGVEPATAALRQLPYRETKRRLAESGPGDECPGHTFSKSEYFRRPLPPEAVTAVLDNLAADRRAGEARVLDFTPWGGAYNRVPADATAFAHRDARFLLKHEVIADPGDPAGVEAARRWLTRSWASVHPWGTAGVYPNFPDPDLDAWSPAYHGANRERLRRVKARYDPGDLLSQPATAGR
jgi:FAD/FMN-containing dehydrogenase